MMEWIPVIFVVFKVLVLGTGMFYAVKWHYDQGKKGKTIEKRVVLLAVGKVSAIFLVALVGLLFFAYFLSTELGLDLTMP